MKYSDIPVFFQKWFGQNADPSTILLPIPFPSQAPANPGRASFTDGWPLPTMTPLSAGGSPPDGRDENGILAMISQWIQWQACAGARPKYDGTFSAAVGGYPAGAILANATTPGNYWCSLVDDNTSNPDTGGANWQALNSIAVGAPLGHIDGLSMDLTNPLGQVDFDPGQCVDDTGTVYIKSINDGEISIDTTITPGTIGGICAGQTRQANHWYAVFACMKADGTIGGMAYDSTSGPNLLKSTLSVPLPSGYIYKRYIGSFKLDGSSNIIPFVCWGGYTFWTTPIVDYNASSDLTTRALITLSTPPGVPCEPIIRAIAHTPGGAGSEIILTSSFFESNIAPSSDRTSAPGFDISNLSAGGSALNVGPAGSIRLLTDLHSQIGARSTTSDSGLTIITRGWFDQRGRQANWDGPDD